MRITQSMINENFTHQSDQNLKRLGDINDMISSRKKNPIHPDDPVVFAMALNFGGNLLLLNNTTTTPRTP